jgi:NADP-dependent 3-hydroxy acid dehydrogenase YdfG
MRDNMHGHDLVGPETMRKRYECALSAETFANMMAFAISQPEHLEIDEILVRPTSQEY